MPLRVDARVATSAKAFVKTVPIVSRSIRVQPAKGDPYLELHALGVEVIVRPKGLHNQDAMERMGELIERGPKMLRELVDQIDAYKRDEHEPRAGDWYVARVGSSMGTPRRVELVEWRPKGMVEKRLYAKLNGRWILVERLQNANYYARCV